MRLAALFLLVFLLLSAGLNAQVNGQLQHVDDKMILHVWGNHFERGYAQGYLLSNRILSMINDYFYVSVCGNSPATYNYLLDYYDARFTVQPKFVSEATGIMEGIAASGQSTYHNGLQRNLEAYDLLMINAIVDLSPVRSEYLGRDDFELGCASISSWGTATMDDPVLNGNLIHTRFMDWTIHPALVANPVLIVHHPAEAQEQKWMSFTYPGLMGALSGISYSGSAAFLNVGNSHGGNNFTGLRHVLFCIREALETADYNSDGTHNLADLNSALSGNRFRSGTIVHAMLDDDANTEPLIFENNNYGTWTRNQSQVSGLPTDHLAATNHFRVMIEPADCYRYTNIINALSADSLMTLDRQWTMLSSAAGVPINLMGIQYIPSLDQVSWATTTQTSVAHLNTPLQLGTTALFNFSPSEVSDPIPPAVISLSCHPNPMKKGEVLKISSEAQLSAITIYNLRGQKLFQQNVSPLSDGLNLDEVLSSSGIYLIRATDRQGRSATAKLMWLN